MNPTDGIPTPHRLDWATNEGHPVEDGVHAGPGPHTTTQGVMNLDDLHRALARRATALRRVYWRAATQRDRVVDLAAAERHAASTENERLRSRLFALESAAYDALSILDGPGELFRDDWARVADALRAALTDEEA